MPGLGRNRCMPGTAVASREGKARPNPSASKTATDRYQGCVTANPMAEAMKGAVQGVATTVASAPVKKEPANPGGDRKSLPTPASWNPNENAPERLSPTANNM